jgi:hypothetical protein
MAANYTGPGTATDPIDLVKKILTWLVSQGWTQDMSQADGAGWRVHAHKSGVYVNMRACVNESTVWAGGQVQAGYGIGLYTGSGFNSASAWNAQAGGPVGSGQSYTVGAGINLPSGAVVATHFFDDGADNVTIVVERTSGVFGHLGFGAAAEHGSGSARRFFFGSVSGFYMTYGGSIPGTLLTAYCPGSNNDGSSAANGFVKADVDAFTGKWISTGNSTETTKGYTGKFAPTGIPGLSIPTGIPTMAGILARSTSSLNSQPNLLPIQIFAERDAGGYSPLVTLPSLAATNATTKGFAVTSVYSIGATNWMLFPNFAVVKGS